MKKIFLYVVIGIIFLAIPLTVILVNRNQELRKRAAPASTISLFPPTQTIREGQTFSFDVKLDTATNQVGLIQIRIVYDPAFLQAIDMTNNPAFAPTIQVSKKIDPNGKVSISVGAKDTLHPITGSGTVATLTMKAIKATSTPLTVKFTSTPDTLANAIGESTQDVLVGRSQASITILNADGSTATNTSLSTATNISTSSAAITTPIPTLIPSLAPSNEATLSANATQSAVTITSITKDEEVKTQTPVIQGKGIPGSTVTLTIHSETQTVVVTVDANGNWTYTPTTPLESGPHTITALYTDPNTGATQSKTQTFVVSPQSTAGGGSSATESAMPVSGDMNTTLLLIGVGIFFIMSGLLIPALPR